MIVPTLHKEPTALDTVLHKDLKLREGLSAVGRHTGFASFMISQGEFAECAREFPILFVRTPPDPQGREQVAPVAVFGMKAGENLFVRDGAWTGGYMPAMLRAYPFTMARVENSDRWAVVFDNSWEGFSRTEGKPLFDAEGKPTDTLTNVHGFVQELETDIERTRLACQRFLELNLLKPMRFEGTQADGQAVAVDGFLTLDEEVFRALPDTVLGELHRNGRLPLLFAHRLSLDNMRRLLERRSALLAAARPAATSH